MTAVISPTPPLSDMQERSLRESTRRLNIWEGSIRSGKTIASLLRWLLYVYDPPFGGALVVVGKTLDTVARNVFGPLQDPALFGPAARFVDYTRGAPTATILGRRIEVITANDARAEGRLRGLTAAGAYVDEATLIPEAFWTTLLGRLSVRGSKLFATTNPDGPAHWLRRKFLLRAGELDLASWHFTIDDNPHLDPAFVAAIKAEYVGLWYRRFILGQWVLAEGAVYSMLDEARHLIDEVPELAALVAVGLDVGTVNPTHAVMLGLTDDGRLCVTREYRHDSRVALRQLTDAEYSRELTAWIGGERPAWVCVDPSAASLKLQLHRDGYANVVDAVNDVLDGVRQVASLLATDQLVIHSSCRHLFDELRSYAWDDKAAEKGDDHPIKVNDHGPDALRYACVTTETLWRHRLRRGLNETTVTAA